MRVAAMFLVAAFSAFLGITIAWSLTGCKMAPPVDPETGRRLYDYTMQLEACDSARDAGQLVRQVTFETCVKREGLDR